jgi:hypothetical protein
VPHPAEDAAGVDRSAWRDGVLLINRLNHPWHLWLDQAKFHAYVDKVQDMGMDARGRRRAGRQRQRARAGGGIMKARLLPILAVLTVLAPSAPRCGPSAAPTTPACAAIPTAPHADAHGGHRRAAHRGRRDAAADGPPQSG